MARPRSDVPPATPIGACVSPCASPIGGALLPPRGAHVALIDRATVEPVILADVPIHQPIGLSSMFRDALGRVATRALAALRARFGAASDATLANLPRLCGELGLGVVVDPCLGERVRLVCSAFTGERVVIVPRVLATRAGSTHVALARIAATETLLCLGMPVEPITVDAVAAHLLAGGCESPASSARDPGAGGRAGAVVRADGPFGEALRRCHFARRVACKPFDEIIEVAVESAPLPEARRSPATAREIDRVLSRLDPHVRATFGGGVWAVANSMGITTRVAGWRPPTAVLHLRDSTIDLPLDLHSEAARILVARALAIYVCADQQVWPADALLESLATVFVDEGSRLQRQETGREDQERPLLTEAS